MAGGALTSAVNPSRRTWSAPNSCRTARRSSIRPQEGVVRDIITDTLTDATDKELIEKKGREHLKEEILKDVKKHTDVKVEPLIFSDLTVQ